jgi:hypothetical protein
MSKNFRSSFLDLLCCRYSKRHFLRANESLRQRTNIHERTSRSFYRKSDGYVQTSVVSRISQLSPMATGIALTTSSSLSRLTSELSPICVSSKQRISTNDTCLASLELNESHQQEQKKCIEHSSTASCYSFVPEPFDVLSTS